MWTTIAEALGITGDGRSPPTFFEHIANLQALLVLDNLEQLPEAAQVIAELLGVAPRVALLGTSRSPLRVLGEYEYPPGSLPLPGSPPPDQPQEGAVELFVQYARMGRPDFRLTSENADDVATICARLDGLPLALEIAAARSRPPSPRALLARLDSSLEFEAGTARDRRNATARCGTRSPGATTCSVLSCRPSSGAWERSPGAAIWRPSQRSPRPEPTRSIGSRSWPMPRCSAWPTGPTASPGRACCRPCRPSPGPHCTRPGNGMRSATHTRRSTPIWPRNSRPGLRARTPSPPATASGPNWRTSGSRWAGAVDKAADGNPPPPERLTIGLRLCQALSWFWYAFGYTAEGHRWQRRAVAAASAASGPELATALHGLAVLLLQQGETAEVEDALTTCLQIRRETGDPQQDGDGAQQPRRRPHPDARRSRHRPDHAAGEHRHRRGDRRRDPGVDRAVQPRRVRGRGQTTASTPSSCSSGRSRSTTGSGTSGAAR